METIYDPSLTVLLMDSNGEKTEYTAGTLSYKLQEYDRKTAEIQRLLKQKYDIKDYLIEHYDDLGGHADELAEIIGEELTKEVELTVTVEFVITAQVKPSENPDTYEDYINENFSFTAESSEDFQYYVEINQVQES